MEQVLHSVTVECQLSTFNLFEAFLLTNLSRTTEDELPVRAHNLLGPGFFLLEPGQDSEFPRSDGDESGSANEDEGDSYASRPCKLCNDSRGYPSCDESESTADPESSDEGELEEVG